MVPLELKDGTERKFINDHDTVIMRSYCENDDTRIGFGSVKTQLIPVFNPKKKKKKFYLYIKFKTYPIG